MLRSPLTKITGVFSCTAAAALLTLLPPAGWSQASVRSVAVIGQIEDAEAHDDLWVELRGDNFRFGETRALVSPSGRFQFSSVKEGQYELIVTNQNKAVIHREFVTVGGGRGLLEIRLPERTTAPVSAGTISAAQLQRKVPRRAVKEYQASLEDARKRHTQQAIGHLAKALAAAPDYMEAHNELGVCELLEQRLEAASEEFQTATNLDPGAPGPASNLSAALYLLKRYSAAEVAARRALKLDPALTKARFLLGMTLHAEAQFSKEMLEDLKRAADQFPQARLAMADALSQLGRKAEAALQLKQYLLQPGAKDRQIVEAWLADLQRHGEREPSQSISPERSSP